MASIRKSKSKILYFTEQGLEVFNYLINKMEYVLKNDQWQLLLNDIKE